MQITNTVLGTCLSAFANCFLKIKQIRDKFNTQRDGSYTRFILIYNVCTENEAFDELDVYPHEEHMPR